MRIHHIATIGFISLMAAVVIGCSRMTAEEQDEVRRSFGVPANVPMKDLGVVELRAGTPKRVRLGAGKFCTITATVLTNGMVQITKDAVERTDQVILNLLYESNGEIIDGVRTQSHSERSQMVFRRPIKGWICLPQMGGLVVAMEPTIIR